MLASTRNNETTSNISPPVIYYENWLLKKEGVNNWLLYWVVIRGKWLQLFETADNGRTKAQLVKTLELTPSTQCTLVKRRKRRFPFSINNGLGNYYMKCDTELERYHWIFSLLTSASGKPKSPLPESIPESMEEKEAFKRSPKKENTQRPTSDYHSKRRQKYAERNEKRHLRKEAKRNRKAEEQCIKRSETLTPVLTKRTDELYRSQKIILGISDKHVKSESVNTIQDEDSNLHYNTIKVEQIKPQNEFIKKTQHKDDLKKPNAITERKLIKVNVMMHPADDATNVSENLGFEASDIDNEDDDDDDEDDDEDVNGFNRIEVISCTDNILPNMVMAHVSDIDSDTESTGDTSIHSQNSLFPNFGSCNDVSDYFANQLDTLDNEPTTPQRKLVYIHEQRLSVPEDNPVLNTLSVKPKEPRVLNVTESRLQKGQGIFERPKSPFDRPVSPRPRSSTGNRPRTQFSRFMVASKDE